MKNIILIATCAVISLSANAQLKIDSSFKSTYYEQKVTSHSLTPVKKGAIIFLGNSITDIGHWEEFFPKAKILNRGISGDITYGIIDRISEVTRHLPKKVFIMIGINDIARGIPDDMILANYATIVKLIQQQSPKTKVYIQSLLPTNDEFDAFKRHQGKTEHVLTVNAGLKALAIASKSTYINLYDALLGNDGKLDKKYTNDGLHINGYGYQKWMEVLKNGNYCCN